MVSCLIHRHLHFVDNNNSEALKEAHGKTWKIQPLIDMVNERLFTVYTPDRDISIDESLAKFKGRSDLIQYIPAKRARFGFKFFISSESGGYINKMMAYKGKGTVPLCPGIVDNYRFGRNVFMVQAQTLLHI